MVLKHLKLEKSLNTTAKNIWNDFNLILIHVIME